MCYIDPIKYAHWLGVLLFLFLEIPDQTIGPVTQRTEEPQEQASWVQRYRLEIYTDVLWIVGLCPLSLIVWTVIVALCHCADMNMMTLCVSWVVNASLCDLGGWDRLCPFITVAASVDSDCVPLLQYSDNI